MNQIEISVGQEGCDINGCDNRALQAAVDYAASFGGGRVLVGPGRYVMRDSLHLRPRVQVEGSGPETVLWKAPASSSVLYLDGDYGEEQITVLVGTAFEVGMGLTVSDSKSGGFHVTVARVTAKDGNTLLIDAPLLSDYMVAQEAVAATTFPVISGYYAEEATVASLAVDGNGGANPKLTGCRGAGIFLYRSHHALIRDCYVHHFNGDGISFQQSNDVVVQDCECAWNADLGLHPGSGSQRPRIERCFSHDNGRIGLFLCWRVRHGTFRDVRVEGNGHSGVSIGHKDTDNFFERIISARNGKFGIHFRDESEPMAGHRNVFRNCEIIGNGAADDGAGVSIEGETHDIAFHNCLIGSTENAGQPYGIVIGPQVANVILEAVEFRGNAVQDILDGRH